MAQSRINRAYEILRTYNGQNNYILYLKILQKKNKLLLTEDGYETDYIIKNKDYVVDRVNRIVKISSEFSTILKSKYDLDFTPEKILITNIIGEMGSCYHCYVQYRRSVVPALMYVKKNYILDELHPIKYDEIEIDLTEYNKKYAEIGRQIKPHQESGIKFLVANKKCILADSMGLGKTVTSILSALVAGCKKILVVTTASLKSTWKRELSYFINPEDIVTISGSRWNGSTGKFTVINYDIVQNYYEVPYEDAYRTEEIVGKDGSVEVLKIPIMTKDKYSGKMVNKRVKSKSKNKILESLKNSPLYTSNFDCVIIDEAQKLSNKNSIRYNVMYDLLRKSNIKYVFLVTGTPLTNTPMNLYNILRLINADVTKDYDYYIMRYCNGKKIFKTDVWNKWLRKFETENGIAWKDMPPLMKRDAYRYIEEHGQMITIPQGYSNLEELREKIKHIYIRRLASDIEGMVNKFVETREYDLSDEQKAEYDKLWDEYLKAQEEKGNDASDEYRQLVEGIIVRQYLAMQMIPNTIKLAEDYLEDGEKVIIVCNFTKEINALKEHFGDIAVTYDGKMLGKQKDNAEHNFMNNPKIKVFIGQELAMSVGLTLTSSHIMIFNSYSWSENDNRQTQDRIYRITQKEDALCIYQLFTDSISQDMFEKVMRKGLIMDETIKSEKEKC